MLKNTSGSKRQLANAWPDRETNAESQTSGIWLCARGVHRQEMKARLLACLPGRVLAIKSGSADVVFAEGATGRQHLVGVVTTLRPLVEDGLAHEAAATREPREGLVATRVIPVIGKGWKGKSKLFNFLRTNTRLIRCPSTVRLVRLVLASP